MEKSESEESNDLFSLDCVVDDPIKFKLKLGIGEDAFTTLKLKNTLQKMWDVKGAAAAGVVAAKSGFVTSTFFAGSGGLLSAIGIGATAATPVGWVIGAAAASGGAYFGVMRLMDKYTDSRVSTVPKFINTPLDLIATNLFDMMSSLALKVTDFGNGIGDEERTAIKDYFIEEWGISSLYIDQALPIVEDSIKNISLKEICTKLAEYQLDNPDCNQEKMREDVKAFLEEIVYADGEMDEREEVALELIDTTLNNVLSTSNQIKRTVSQKAESAASLVKGATKSLQQIDVNKFFKKR